MSLTTTRLAPLVTEALLGASSETNATNEAILTATVECIGRFGLDRFSIEDVAQIAGVGRATVFRRFGTKEEIVRRTIAREGMALLEELKSSVAGIENPSERIVEFGVTAARLRRDHPIMSRLVADGSILSLLDDRPVVSLLRSTAERELAALYPDQDVDIEALAEVCIRLFGSLCVLPDFGLRTDDETIRRLIRAVFPPIS